MKRFICLLVFWAAPFSGAVLQTRIGVRPFSSAGRFEDVV
jgi:nitric oxide synthase oxygenase domain/subunit